MELEIIEHDEIEIDFEDSSFVLDNDYKNIKNKPSINDVVLDGNKTLKELGIQGTEEGMGLSERNFTEEYEEKLKELENYDDTEIKKSIENLGKNKVDKVEGKGLSTEDFTTELKTKLEGLSNYDDTEIKDDLKNKVDKEEGKGLSTNDFTNAYKQKLDSLENYNDKEITDALDQANTKIAELEQKVALQDEQIPTRRRNRRKHYIK